MLFILLFISIIDNLARWFCIAESFNRTITTTNAKTISVWVALMLCCIRIKCMVFFFFFILKSKMQSIFGVTTHEPFEATTKKANNIQTFGERESRKLVFYSMQWKLLIDHDTMCTHKYHSIYHGIENTIASLRKKKYDYMNNSLAIPLELVFVFHCTIYYYNCWTFSKWS